MAKLKWKVQEAPTGRYRSFDHRGWPTADHPDGRMAVALYCEDRYVPSLVRDGSHKEIKICVASYNHQLQDGRGFVWRTLKKRAATLQEAKTIAADFIDKNPNF